MTKLFVALFTFILTSIGTLLTKHYWDKRSNRVENDQALFHDFKQLLPSCSGLISGFNDFDYGDSFNGRLHAPLEEFVVEWGAPEKEFLTKEVEESKAQLIAASKSFLDKLNAEACSVGHERYGIRDPDQRNPDIIEQQRRAVRDVNELANKVFDAHQMFIRLSMQKGLASVSLSRQWDSSS